MPKQKKGTGKLRSKSLSKAATLRLAANHNEVLLRA
jgi:hypothetical protein